MNSKLYKSKETETIGDGQICIVPYSSIESLKCGLCKAEKHDIEIIKNLTECRFVPAMSYKEILSYANISMYYLKDYDVDYFFVVFIIRLNKSFNKIFNKNTDCYISINDIEKKYNNLPYIDKLIATEILYDNYNTVTTE